MIRVQVDLRNPGQFFGCCGLFELAIRLWPDTTARFEAPSFILSSGDLAELVTVAATTPLTSVDEADKSASPIRLEHPFNLTLDWWKEGSGDPGLKPWAGTMLAQRIACAMQGDLAVAAEHGLFDFARVVRDENGKKVEPFYFDARRGAIALPLDMGFSPDALGLESIAYPATEFLTLVGLQRFRPAGAKQPRVYRYRAWQADLPAALAALATADAIPDRGPLLVFENAFRTDQRKHKAFSPAVHILGDDYD